MLGGIGNQRKQREKSCQTYDSDSFPSTAFYLRRVDGVSHELHALGAFKK